MEIVRRGTREQLVEHLASNAAVLLLGPRQVGKTTLAREIADSRPHGAVYLDLENPTHRRRLSDPGAYLRAQAPRLVIIDEAQRDPELFDVLRGVIDDNRRAGHRYGQFLLLGSASLDLVGLTESLAGRVSHLELTGIRVDEAHATDISAERLWLRGGYPDSVLADSDTSSLMWRENIVRSYLERDVPMFAPRIPAETLRRLWTMIAHTSGGLLNASSLGQALAVKGQTIDRYLDLLADLYLIRRLPSWHANVGKRVTKAPKILMRDSGLLHALLGLETIDDVLGHPAAGHSYESFAIENLIAAAGNRYRPHHYRTAKGDEIDLVLERGGVPAYALDVKRSTAPDVSAGLLRARNDIGAPKTYVVHPDTGDEPYPVGDVTVIGLREMVKRLLDGTA
ncbi:ATP-binding protein [Microbacterium sp.]|uniref:ATP-binding protein n=1 Tax=Microbacterium sp. TaxID=51671 RepID=UPI0039E6F79F